ncbi:MAG TPA: peptidylprolyl isomerase [Saprospiraceae bacterium]|nr:peptidylprolyl isomerase [Saprospiraceae bacterium]
MNRLKSLLSRASLMACLMTLLMSACQKKENKALISTEYGDITIVLFDSTPKHRDNFIKLVKEGYYDDLLFHRVIDEFMIQGGDPDSKNSQPGARLGIGGPGYEIDAEIGSPHLYGALAAARTPNEAKRSSGSQFFIVTGKTQSDAELKVYEQRKNIKYNDEQRRIYEGKGGYPALDMEYTVFGEVVSGMDVVEKIAKLEKDANDRPLKDVKMKIKMI